jgi:4-hydroxy-tetrahydrodipicolinate reductase
MTKIKVAVTGAAGRMGRQIISGVLANEEMTLCRALEKQGHPKIGLSVPGSSAIFDFVDTKEPEFLTFALSNVIIDFTEPTVAMTIIKRACESRTAVVTGTTGFTAEHLEQIREYAKIIPILPSSNFSIGVNLLLRTIRDYASILNEDFDIDIVETHHRLKKDAPSGTAIKMAGAAAEGRGRKLNDVVVCARHGMIGERKRGEIGIQTLRFGDVVGEHTIIFGASGERIEFTHKASSREVFARGALKAAEWIVGKPPGIYSMNDVLGLK